VQDARTNRTAKMLIMDIFCITLTLLPRHRFINSYPKLKNVFFKSLFVVVSLALLYLGFIKWISVSIPCVPPNRFDLKKIKNQTEPLHQIYPIFSELTKEEWRKLVHSHVNGIQFQKGSKIFDSGCGSGAFLDILKEEYQIEVTGIDMDPTLIKLANSRVNGTFYQGDPRNLDFLPPEQYDYVFSFNLFQYFKNKKDVKSTIAQLSRLAKPNAPIMIGFVNDLKQWNLEDENNCEQNVFLDYQFWKDMGWEFGLEDLNIISERLIQGWFGEMEGKSYQYSVYLKKAGIITGKGIELGKEKEE